MQSGWPYEVGFAKPSMSLDSIVLIREILRLHRHHFMNYVLEILQLRLFCHIQTHKYERIEHEPTH